MLDAVFFNKSFRNGSSGRKIQHFGGEIKYGAEDPGLLFLCVSLWLIIMPDIFLSNNARQVTMS